MSEQCLSCLRILLKIFAGDLVPYLYKERVEGETVESKDAIEQEKAREEEEFKEKQKDKNGKKS